MATPKPAERVVNASDVQEEHVGECGSVPAGAAIPPSPAGCGSSRAASSYDREQLVVACISASCDMMRVKSGRAPGHSDMLHRHIQTGFGRCGFHAELAIAEQIPWKKLL